MSNDSLDALPHLPKLPPHARLTDDGVDFHSELLYLRGLLDEIEDACDTTGGRIVFDNLIMRRAASVAVFRQHPLAAFAPWPNDEACELLASWRAERRAA